MTHLITTAPMRTSQRPREPAIPKTSSANDGGGQRPASAARRSPSRRHHQEPDDQRAPTAITQRRARRGATETVEAGRQSAEWQPG